MKVIRAFDGDLVTAKFLADPVIVNGKIVSDIDNDILKLNMDLCSMWLNH
jgi:hypothetical protein